MTGIISEIADYWTYADWMQRAVGIVIGIVFISFLLFTAGMIEAQFGERRESLGTVLSLQFVPSSSSFGSGVGMVPDGKGGMRTGTVLTSSHTSARYSVLVKYGDGSVGEVQSKELFGQLAKGDPVRIVWKRGKMMGMETDPWLERIGK